MQQDTHSKAIGYIMWIFGFMGMHRFYYGRQITGLIWLLTGGVFLIGWIIDFFLIPDMNEATISRYTAGDTDYSVAWILLVFLGILGIHRFYLGKWATGIIWLFSLGLFGFGVLYDLWTLNAQVSERNRQPA